MEVNGRDFCHHKFLTSGTFQILIYGIIQLYTSLRTVKQDLGHKILLFKVEWHRYKFMKYNHINRLTPNLYNYLLVVTLGNLKKS